MHLIVRSHSMAVSRKEALLRCLHRVVHFEPTLLLLDRVNPSVFWYHARVLDGVAQSQSPLQPQVFKCQSACYSTAIESVKHRRKEAILCCLHRVVHFEPALLLLDRVNPSLAWY